jgi:hypothetical protein
VNSVLSSRFSVLGQVRNASVLGCLKSLSSYSEGINPCLLPPPPRSIGIIGLGRNSSQIFEFKGLIRKIFRNKDLGCQRALKMGLGQLRGASWLTDTPRNCPNQISIVTHDGAYVNGFYATTDTSPWPLSLRAGLTEISTFRRRFGLWDVLPALDPHFVPIKKSSLTKPRPGERDFSCVMLRTTGLKSMDFDHG